MQKTIMKKIIFVISVFLLFISSCSKDSGVSNQNTGLNGGNNTGTGGSLAKFTIVNNHMYCLDYHEMKVFDISNTQNPVYKNKITINFDIEAMFPYNNKLFVASRTAMYIYNVNNPENPVLESQVQHLTGCDPVVVKDNYAYLTIHGGNRCGNTFNQLQVYDVSDIRYPQFIKSYDLTSPLGLGVQDNYLYVCDQNSGLVIFDISKPNNPEKKYIFTGEKYMDVIPMGNYMICMVEKGVVFLDITNPLMIKKLSTIKG